MALYDIFWNYGPQFRDIEGLAKAKRLAESMTPMERGWTAAWESSRVERHMMKKVKPYTHYLYVVKNSKGRTVNVVNVTPVTRGQ